MKYQFGISEICPEFRNKNFTRIDNATQHLIMVEKYCEFEVNLPNMTEIIQRIQLHLRTDRWLNEVVIDDYVGKLES